MARSEPTDKNQAEQATDGEDKAYAKREVEEQRLQTHDTGRDTEQAQQIAPGGIGRAGTAGIVGDQADCEQRDGEGEGVLGDELGGVDPILWTENSPSLAILLPAFDS
jgi:hypothetical protein